MSRDMRPVLHMILHGLIYRWDVHMLDFDKNDRVSHAGHIIDGASMSTILRHLLYFEQPTPAKAVPGQVEVLRAILALKNESINQHLAPHNSPEPYPLQLKK